MNDKIRKHVNKIVFGGRGDVYDDRIIEAIMDEKIIWRGDPQKSRWWIEYFSVVEIGGMFIGFWDAETTGDLSPTEAGWEFNSNSIVEVEPYEIKTVGYREV